MSSEKKQSSSKERQRTAYLKPVLDKKLDEYVAIKKVSVSEAINRGVRLLVSELPKKSLPEN